jgi:uncharacterized protein (TIGR02996 family)
MAKRKVPAPSRSTDEQALLAEILEHPGDDTPRLVYAYWLDEHGNHDAVARLASSEFLSRLTRLSLWECSVGDAGVEALAASPYAVNLYSLDLQRNKITAAGAKAIVAAPYLGNLTTIRLNYNRLGDEGKAALEERFGDGVVAS